nr:hypothetical protein [Tanacetum cinerariifolium]
MPELRNVNDGDDDDVTTSYGSVSVKSDVAFWSKRRDDVTFNQLQKFWSDLPLQARQELLRIDKQSLFEQARKNMYCSRCNGLLLEGFMQIVMYGKSLQLEGMGGQGSGNRLGASKSRKIEDVCLTIGGNDDVQDPSVHPWGGLATTKDGTLTLLDCYICAKYLKGLQNVFDSARSREREREKLYPDACGGKGRGWISQGIVGYGRGHGSRETCALHTARLSVGTLVDFWSALGEETRYSLLRMKEEDFMERLMYRFDSKRFCRDCRKNVIREFKELKELKRIKREARCTSWFCVADTSFQYEVTLDTIHADWHQNYADSTGIYEHYEWAVGTGEGKSDILEFENVGSKARVKASGLDLNGLNACYITLRAWRSDGRCNEVSVKAHALKGQHCVHGRLVVGDGFVTISRGESIRRFFEHAEEAEEEEDDDSMDKDGNELDGECSRPQKHAKSPELAREFLLDAATVIFKEQVEKAFREGTARQNAHSMFVSLALKLLEHRVMVACKDIITLEKQCKLLEEEEKEKRDEEERKERRRTKEKEKKLRRKERLRSKEKEKEKNCSEPTQISTVPDVSKEELTSDKDEIIITNNTYCEDQDEDTPPSIHASEDYTQEEQILDYDENCNAEFSYRKNGNHLFDNDQSKHPRRRLKPWKDYHLDQSTKWSDTRRFESGFIANKPGPRFHNNDGFETFPRTSNFIGVNKPIRRSNGSRYTERSHCSHNNRNNGWYDSSACNCYQHNDYRPKISKPENKYSPKAKSITGNYGLGRDSPYTKKVWEPMETQKRSDLSAVVTESVKRVDSSDGTHSSPTNQKDIDLKDATSSLSGTTDVSSSSSSNSSSDSCSTCLSEGDGNTSFSSNPQNPESSSTSDSEYASHHSEVTKETSLCIEKEFSDCGTVKETSLCVENEFPDCGTTIKAENTKATESVPGSQPQGNNIIQPPLQAQSMHFPMFQAPMGYYHQGPVPWTTSPTNGLMPLPHPNHYLFASPFGYGSGFLQYGVGGLQPLAPPLLSHGQLPMYQPVPPINGISKAVPATQKVEQKENSDTLQNRFSTGAGGQNGNVDNTEKGDIGFSLFHFGGPVDVSNGFNPDAVAAAPPPRKEVEINNCLKTSGDSCGAKDMNAVEEYNLFAASNGIKFSFF